MKFYGRSQEIAEKIVGMFKEGNLAEPLSQVFIKREDNTPSSSWSWSNRLMVMLSGCVDARGIKQWREAGRSVKGHKASAFILFPKMRKGTRINKQTQEEEKYSYIYGFGTSPVWDITNTEGDDLPVDEDSRNYLDSLPLKAVAEKWGIDVQGMDSKETGSLGFITNKADFIGLGVRNLSTWAHELIHGADLRMGTLTEEDPKWKSETVAELGGAVLLTAIGFEVEADLGGAWDYISSYAEAVDKEPVQVCTEVLNRTCNCVQHILEEAEALES